MEEQAQNTSTNGSALLTPKVARMAIIMATPSIGELMHSGLFKRKVMAVGVVDGTCEREDGELELLAKAIIKGDPMGGAIYTLADDPNEGFLTEEDSEERKFEEVFVAKASLTSRTQSKTLTVREFAPQFLQINDTVYQGSYIDNGIIVAASGDRAYFDEAVSGIIGQIALGLVRYKMDLLKEQQVGFITPEIAAQLDEALGD